MAGIFNARPWRNIDETGPSPANDARPETPLQKRRREHEHLKDAYKAALEHEQWALQEQERLHNVWKQELERIAGVVEAASKDLEDVKAIVAAQQSLDFPGGVMIWPSEKVDRQGREDETA